MPRFKVDVPLVVDNTGAPPRPSTTKSRHEGETRRRETTSSPTSPRPRWLGTIATPRRVGGARPDRMRLGIDASGRFTSEYRLLADQRQRPSARCASQCTIRTKWRPKATTVTSRGATSTVSLPSTPPRSSSGGAPRANPARQQHCPFTVFSLVYFVALFIALTVIAFLPAHGQQHPLTHQPLLVSGHQPLQ